MNWLTEALQEWLVIVLAHFVWQGIVIAGVLPALVTVLNIKRPNGRYASSLFAFVLMAVCPIATWYIVPNPGVRRLDAPLHPPHDQFTSDSNADVFAKLQQVPPAEMSDFNSRISIPLLEHSYSPLEFPSPIEGSPLKSPTASGWEEILRPFEPWIIGAWLCGVGVLSLRLLLGAIGIWRWRRSVESIPEALQPVIEQLWSALSGPCLRFGLQAMPRVRVCRRVAEAVAVGLFKPLILLPAAWMTELPSDMLEAVIAHELAHIRRFDLWVNLLQRIVETLLFYHPAVWWLSRRLRIERELCCDELAATVTNNRLRYAETLEHVARMVARPESSKGVEIDGVLDHALRKASERATDPLTVAMSTREGVLLHRIRQLLGVTSPHSTGTAWLAGLLTLGLVLTIAGGTFVSSRAEAEPPIAEQEGSAGRGSPDPALNSTVGLPKSDDAPSKADNTSEDLRSKPAAGSGDPLPAPQESLKPKGKEAQSLFKKWQVGARANGNIPGGTLGPLVRVMTNFIKNNPTHEGAPKFAELLKRIDTTHDWTPAEAIALLDEVTAIYASLPEWVEGEPRFTLGGPVVTGKPLPDELKNAPWGEAQPSGLRVAWLLEPRALKYRLGTPLKSRILFHNAGKNSVVFRALTWNQSGNHKALDADGKEINIVSTYWTTLPQEIACRLAPDEFLEVTAAGIGIGANKDEEDWRGTRVGSWIEAKEGDEVTFVPAAVDCDGREAGQPEGEESLTPQNWWPKFIADRLSLDAPLPADAAERKRLLDRATRDLFGNAPTPEEITAFTTDAAPEALDALAKRLASRAGFVTFSGSLQSGTRKFLVLPADPDAAKRPRVASNPGWYTLGDNVRLSVTRRSLGDRIVNEANILFFSSDPKAAPPGKPVAIPLPDGYSTWAAAWERGGTVLWVLQKGSVCSYDFSNPTQVKETQLKPGNILDVPEALREALKEALEFPGVPKQQRVPQPPVVPRERVDGETSPWRAT